MHLRKMQSWIFSYFLFDQFCVRSSSLIVIPYCTCHSPNLALLFDEERCQFYFSIYYVKQKSTVFARQDAVGVGFLPLLYAYYIILGALVFFVLGFKIDIYFTIEVRDWKVSELESVRMHLSSKLESVSIGKCQNWKVSEFSHAMICILMVTQASFAP